MFKNTLVSGLIATAVAAATLAGTVQPSAAHSHHHNHDLGIGIAAGVGGSSSAACWPSPAPSMSTKAAARGMSAAATIVTPATIWTPIPILAATDTATIAVSEGRTVSATEGLMRAPLLLS